jgi:hypothetical protein
MMRPLSFNLRKNKLRLYVKYSHFNKLPIQNNVIHCRLVQNWENIRNW